jgi:hypothetical protein
VLFHDAYMGRTNGTAKVTLRRRSILERVAALRRWPMRRIFMSNYKLTPRPQPSRDREPSGIAADDAGATSLAEKMARNAPRSQIASSEKARLGAEASRDEDA